MSEGGAEDLRTPGPITLPSEAPGFHQTLEAGARVGDYVLEALLGSGGMGVVFRAREQPRGDVVALKVLGHALDHPANVARFRREAQAVARLNHPGIAAVRFV